MADGQRLVEGKVAETCAANGLRAVCWGPVGNEYTDTTKCLVTPLSTPHIMSVRVNNILLTITFPTLRTTLAKKVCPETPNSKNCPQLEGVFSYMKNYSGGECGKVGPTACAKGKDYVSGPEKRYYAYCVQQI